MMEKLMASDKNNKASPYNFRFKPTDRANERTNERMNEQTSKQTNKRPGRTNGQTYIQ